MDDFDAKLSRKINLNRYKRNLERLFEFTQVHVNFRDFLEPSLMNIVKLIIFQMKIFKKPFNNNYNCDSSPKNKITETKTFISKSSSKLQKLAPGVGIIKGLWLIVKGIIAKVL